MERLGLYAEEGDDDDQAFCETAQHSPNDHEFLDFKLFSLHVFSSIEDTTYWSEV